MKLPVQWLREYVDTPVDDDALAERLTMAGLEVEEITESEIGPIFHTKVTANRGDWLSAVGTAREAAAALDVPLAWHANPLPDENDDVRRWVGVKVADPALCPRYAGKVIRNLTPRPSPDWMQKRLIAAGMRPLSIIVDITNYVMLELGQPLHAFDYDTLPEGQIIVRPAQEGERIETLDGITRDLMPGMLVICDKDKPVCIAGIMGDARTEVSGATRHIFLEAAHFDPGSIRRTSKALGLSTEASHRFERAVDPGLVPIALERACDLLADLAGGEVVLGRIDLYPRPAQARTITLRPSRANAILGTGLSEDTVAYSLRRLGLIVDATREPFLVTVPTYRPDLVKEIDLIEEVGRMVGYETLPETIPPAHGGGGGDADYSVFGARLRTALVGLGLNEALTHILTAPSPFDDPVQADRRVTIRQALSAELSGLRQELTPNLLEALSSNLRRRQPDIRLFEIGKVFALGAGEGSYTETRHLAALLTGAAAPRAWNTPNSPACDFFTAKGLIESLAAKMHWPMVTFAPEQRPKMHPGRSASVTVAGKTIGYVAEVDPDAARSELDIPAAAGRIAVFELDCDALLALMNDSRQYQPSPRFPAVSRDLAVVVDTAVPYALLRDTALAAADSALLEEVTLVSLYIGEHIPAGKKSIALRLIFRASDRTLTDSEIDAQISQVQALLTERAGADRR